MSCHQSIVLPRPDGNEAELQVYSSDSPFEVIGLRLDGRTVRLTFSGAPELDVRLDPQEGWCFEKTCPCCGGGGTVIEKKKP